MYHLLRETNAEVESNFKNLPERLKVTNHSYWLINNDVCYLGQLGSVGANNLIPCKPLLKISVKYPTPPPMWCFLCCSINIEQSPLSERNTHTEGRHCLHEVENSNLGSVLVK